MFFMREDRASGGFTPLPKGRRGSLRMHSMFAHVDPWWLIRRREVEP
jgi:hypothetical protein